MTSKLVVGPIKKGLKNDVTPFNIDNDAFPVLINAYQWRGRVKRKRGTSLLGRLNTTLGTTDGAGNFSVTISPVPITSGISQFKIGSDVFLDPGGANPVNLVTNSSGTGSLNRTTGLLTINGSQATTAVQYFPGFPVLGLEDLVLTADQFPGTLGFDTTYSYNILTATPYNIYSVTFYKNPATGGAGYAPKGTWTPFNWNSDSTGYQQFWTFNYENALWATNGIRVPFDPTVISMQFKRVGANGAVMASATDVDFTTTNNHPFVAGDFVFANEFTGITGLNFQTGYVLAAPAPTATTFRARFPNATIAGGPGSNGIVQALTTSCLPDVSSTTPTSTKDCLRWYDGDPTSGASPYTPSTSKGWVNFCPPLLSGATTTFVIDDAPVGQYYLVDARIIVPFKDRLLFFGPVIQTQTGTPIYLQDTIIYSQNGTAFYTCSFSGSATSATTQFFPMLLPDNQTATASAYFEDVTGFGGFITAGIANPIISAAPNEDVILIGFANNRQARLVYTGNDIVPFNFYIINSEFGDLSTFGYVTLDRGKISAGDRGLVLSSQVSSQRVDLDIPDEIFEFKLQNNGAQRVTAQRDFINEWIYFTYCSSEIPWTFPTQTLLYNYRDNSWAIFHECFTTYGQFRKTSGYTWSTIGSTFSTWSVWNQPWNAGSTTIMQPEVIGGNQQGFVFFRDDGTNESTSLYIQSFGGSGNTTVTSPNHCLNNGDFIVISGCLGTLGNTVNGRIFQVTNTTTNTFLILSNLPTTITGTYSGGGLITRMYIPFIQTKQFPMAWDMGRKTRIGAQRYLFTTTSNGQIELQIYLSQDASNPYNFGPVVPSVNSQNDALVYSDILYTCLESVNLGLTPANQNLQQIGVINSSATGTPVTITGITQANPAVVTASNSFSVGQYVQISGIVGMTNLNGNTYPVVSATSTTFTISVDSTLFPAYSSGGSASLVQFNASSPQEQMWHRMNTSLIGDTVQIGFTLSEDQMRSLSALGPSAIITNATQANPCVLTAANNFAVGQLIEISGVQGMTQLNGNIYYITMASSSSITIAVDASGFTAYSSSGVASVVAPNYQFAEIELHGFILDISPSQMLI